jgi:hypothetical protein
MTTGLLQNVWLFYPPGYIGSYINWGIKKSHLDLAGQTLDDPVLPTGSSHALVRIPTHQAFDIQLSWLINTRPKQKSVIPVAHQYHVMRDTWLMENFNVVSKILTMIEPYLFLINIHHGDDADAAEICALNQIDKWPVSWEIIHKLNYPGSYNPWSDSDHLRARNWLADNWKEYIIHPNRLNKKQFANALRYHKLRLKLRQAYDVSGEITDDQYPIAARLSHTLYEIEVNQILDPGFVRWFESNIDHKVLGKMNFDYWDEFHRTKWLQTQKTRHWKDIKTAFIEHGDIHPYIKTNRLAEALVFYYARLRDPSIDMGWTLEQLADHIRPITG